MRRGAAPLLVADNDGSGRERHARAGARPWRGLDPLPRRDGRAGAARAPMQSPRRIARIWPRRGGRPALCLSRLEIRRRRHMPRPADGAQGIDLQAEGTAGGLCRAADRGARLRLPRSRARAALAEIRPARRRPAEARGVGPRRAQQLAPSGREPVRSLSCDGNAREHLSRARHDAARDHLRGDAVGHPDGFASAHLLRAHVPCLPRGGARQRAARGTGILSVHDLADADRR